MRCMTADEIVDLVTSMPGAVAITASEGNGAPEASASQSWVCILNPGAASGTQARSLLSHAHTRARERHQRPAQ
jgi:hypothetical protein